MAENPPEQAADAGATQDRSAAAFRARFAADKAAGLHDARPSGESDWTEVMGAEVERYPLGNRATMTARAEAPPHPGAAPAGVDLDGLARAAARRVVFGPADGPDVPWDPDQSVVVRAGRVETEMLAILAVPSAPRAAGGDREGLTDTVARAIESHVLFTPTHGSFTKAAREIAEDIVDALSARSTGTGGRGRDDGPSWIDLAAWCAEGLLAAIPPHYGEARDGCGKSVAHLRWMARQLADRQLDSETKACRWLGWLQAGVVWQGYSTLEAEKLRNQASKVAVTLTSSVGKTETPSPDRVGAGGVL